MQRFFEFVDEDHSGSLDYAELFTITRRVCREAKVSDLKSVLDSLFKHAGDISGVISLADLAKWSVDQEFGIRLEDGIRVGCYNRFDSLINYV